MDNENKPKRINLDLPPSHYQKLCAIQGTLMKQKKRPVSQVETLLTLINRFDVDADYNCDPKIEVKGTLKGFTKK